MWNFAITTVLLIKVTTEPASWRPDNTTTVTYGQCIYHIRVRFIWIYQTPTVADIDSSNSQNQPSFNG